MRHEMRLVAPACAVISASAWLANYLELTWLRPTACTLGRMQLESWLLFARGAALVLPVVGVLMGAVALKPWSRAGGVAVASNAAVIAAVAIALCGHVRDGWLHLPCLRN
jgi:hypothetical protein